MQIENSGKNRKLTKKSKILKVSFFEKGGVKLFSIHIIFRFSYCNSDWSFF